MQMKTIHRAYKDEIIRAYGFIAKIRIWNSGREPDNKSLLKLIDKNFKELRETIGSGLDRTHLDRKMQDKEYRLYKFVIKNLPRSYVMKNFEKTANNTDLFINLYLEISTGKVKS
jgi:hypothetical protein